MQPYDKYKLNIANNVKRLRMETKLSRKYLAKRSGVSEAAIGRMESETNNSTIETLALVSRSLGVVVEDLLQDTEYVDVVEVDRAIRKFRVKHKEGKLVWENGL